MTADALVPLADRVHARLLAGRDPALEGAGPSLDRAAVETAVRAEAPLADPGDAAATVERVLARVRGLGAIDHLLAGSEVSEVMVNPDGAVWVERRGRLVDTGERVEPDEVLRLLERIVSPLGLRVDRSSPMVDARLPDGSRVNAVVPPLAVDGPAVTIRRFGARPIELDGLCPPGVADLLRTAVGDRANVVVSGGSGAGKTTLLNALAAGIGPDERVVTIEDAAELRLSSRHVVRLEARPPNLEGVGAVTIRDLVRNALRMRPDRIVVGEVRGGEALDMVQALNTGHRGSLTTCHANGPADALRRLETMCLMAGVGLPAPSVREHLHRAVDLVVQVERRADGERRLTQVLAVGDPDDPARGSVVADDEGLVG